MHLIKERYELDNLLQLMTGKCQIDDSLRLI